MLSVGLKIPQLGSTCHPTQKYYFSLCFFNGFRDNVARVSGSLGAESGHLEVILGPSWGLVGATWGYLGSYQKHLGPSCVPFGVTWRPVKTSLGQVGVILCILGPCLAHFGATSGSKKASSISRQGSVQPQDNLNCSGGAHVCLRTSSYAFSWTQDAAV